MVKYVSTYYGFIIKKGSEKDLFEDDYVIFFLFSLQRHMLWVPF